MGIRSLPATVRLVFDEEGKHDATPTSRYPKIPASRMGHRVANAPTLPTQCVRQRCSYCARSYREQWSGNKCANRRRTYRCCHKARCDYRWHDRAGNDGGNHRSRTRRDGDTGSNGRSAADAALATGDR